MPFVKGQSGNAAGRKPGAQNKLTTTVKEAIEQVAQGLGGTERMTKWAAENPENEKLFWSNIYPKLLPHTINGSVTLDPLKRKD